MNSRRWLLAAVLAALGISAAVTIRDKDSDGRNVSGESRREPPKPNPYRVADDPQARRLMRAGLLPRVAAIVEKGEALERLDFADWESIPLRLDSTGDILFDVPPSENEDENVRRVQSVVDRLQKDRRVRKIEVDGMIVAAAPVIPDDQSFGQQWALDNPADRDINAPEAWEALAGVPSGERVVVAVIDTGVGHEFSELKPNIWTNKQETDRYAQAAKDDDANGYADDIHGLDALTLGTSTGALMAGDPWDHDGHGTPVAAIIGAVGDNKKKIAGINWRVDMIVCKALTRVAAPAVAAPSSCGAGATCVGRTSDAAICLDYVAKLKSQKIDVVATNNSWTEIEKKELLERAIAAHRKLGILLIAAAGNVSGEENPDSDVIPRYPGSYWQTNVIAVAATDAEDKLVNTSSYGKRSVHLAAPGDKILTLFPNTDPNASPADVEVEGDFHQTSSAAPHVTGVITLLRAYQPGLKWYELRNRILAGGRPVSSLETKTATRRRLLAWENGGGARAGALSCKDQIVERRLRPTRNCVTVAKNEVVGMAALHIRCEKPAGGVTVKVSPGTTATNVAPEDASFKLLDGGGSCADLAGPECDQVEGDGIYAGSWRSGSPGVYKLDFSTTPGAWNGEMLKIRVGKHPTKSCPALD